MTKRAYTTIDKTEWGPGPWNTEPDKTQWVDEPTGLDCLAVRNPHMGNWCGYVGLPPEHPWHGKTYDDLDIDVHGGLTYSEACDENATEEHGICHVPDPGRPDDVWWLGFDCGHAHDTMPGLRARERALGLPEMPPMPGPPGPTYKPLAYVQAECASLARQLAQ